MTGENLDNALDGGGAQEEIDQDLASNDVDPSGNDQVEDGQPNAQEDFKDQDEAPGPKVYPNDAGEGIPLLPRAALPHGL